MDFWKAAVSSTEFISAALGALVGGFVTFWVGWWQTRKVLRHERAMVAAATAREAAVVLLEAHAKMRTYLGELGASKWKPYPSASGMFSTVGRSDHPAVEALEEVLRLDTSRARLLPKDLSGIWYEFGLLLGDYRRLLVTHEMAGWPEGKRNRVTADVQNYMAFVGEALAIFIRTDVAINSQERPRLTRDGDEEWQPAQGADVGTLWERTRSELANWRERC